MDTVAQEIGASKKTLYQWYENKDKLVEAALNEFLDEVKVGLQKPEENSVEELVKTLWLHNQKVAGITVSFFYDLKKYHAKANQKLQEYLNEELRPFFIRNLQNGMAMGCYRNNLHPEIVANLCIANFSVVVDQEIFPAADFNQQELRFQVFALFMRGIVTPKGKALLLTSEAKRLAE